MKLLKIAFLSKKSMFLECKKKCDLGYGGPNRPKTHYWSLTLKMFPMPNIHILTLMTSRWRKDKKEEVDEKCPEKSAIISRDALSRESLSWEEVGLFKCLYKCRPEAVKHKLPHRWLSRILLRFLNISYAFLEVQ